MDEDNMIILEPPEEQKCAECADYEQAVILLLLVALIAPMIGMLIGMFAGKKLMQN